MCDNCAFSKEIVDMDVTEHAKSLVTIVKETSDVDQKSTMLQLVDLWRSRARQPGGDAWLAKDLSKEDVERVIIQLILDGILKEEFSHTAYATNAYVALGTGSRFLLQGNRKVQLEIIKGVHSVKKGAKAARNKSSEEEMKSGMGRMLDELRFKLATDHGGIFPHSVLSSQHITALCSSKPVSLEQVEQITGKRIAEKYGKEILASISGYIEKNPDSPSKTGLWVTPKGKRPLQGGSASVTPKVGSSRLVVAKTPSSSKKTVFSARKPSAVVTQSVKTPAKTSVCIDLDSDTDQQEDAPPAKGAEAAMHNSLADEIESSDDDFALFKRVKR